MVHTFFVSKFVRAIRGVKKIKNNQKIVLI
jgi:hypothetical protein